LAYRPDDRCSDAARPLGHQAAEAASRTSADLGPGWV